MWIEVGAFSFLALESAFAQKKRELDNPQTLFCISFVHLWFDSLILFALQVFRSLSIACLWGAKPGAH